ncbi:BTAD domain-containing putative transcriptional regulator [Wenjunlia tyrosinilytica]|uniref:BTAD domain-containing putative transcriptional regulator n=1 Tax=Wenjunlia tyrosinilytica TaxID=1544741 RepID=UPI002247DCA0|nr:BTAD domain-containing putative transcriptional regulator [Wenjunlia tyrosinilytica]
MGGIAKRATLSYLLIHANRVVATSGLLNALWPGDTPLTARKMLQNAVSDLRRVLSADIRAADRAMLLTHTPGYVLRVDVDCVDLFHYRQLVDQGRADLTAGAYESAARVLRQALALWRGPALADLVETGVAWPELAALENARLDALEDCIEAELASGRHNEVLGELEALVATEPSRERLCGQLMLALYRCGRQTDALAAYRRARTRLVERYGLEPGPELQRLEQAILSHAPELEAPTRAAPSGAVDGAPDTAEARPAAIVSPVMVRGGGGKPAVHRGPERKQISAVLLWAHSDTGDGGQDPAGVDDVLREVESTVREECERFGGSVGSTLGPVHSALFGVADTSEDHAVRAVRAGLAIRDRLGAHDCAAGTGRPGTDGRAHVAVVTGDAFVRIQPGDTTAPPMVTGGVLDQCLRLLALVPPGEVRVSEATRRASETGIVYRVGPEPPSGWEALGARRMEREPARALGLHGREAWGRFPARRASVRSFRFFCC